MLSIKDLESLPVGAVILDGTGIAVQKIHDVELNRDVWADTWGLILRFTEDIPQPITLLIPKVVTEEMIVKAVEVWKKPKRMHTNTSDGNLRDRMAEVLATVLGGV